MLLMLAVVIFADDEWLCPLLSLQQPCSAMLQHPAVSGRRRRESLRVDSNYVQSLDQPSPTLATWLCEALLDVNMLDNLLHLLLKPWSIIVGEIRVFCPIGVLGVFI